MSSQKTLTPQESYDVLVSQVHAPVFFEKLARVYGVQPQTPDEAKELLLIAGQLRNAHEQQTVKSAEARGGALSEARHDLNQVLVREGFGPLVDDDRTIKTAAEQAVQNPMIKEAALVFGQYLTEALQSR